MLFETNKDKGRAGLALGIAWFGANGYSVNIPLNDTQWYDFVAEKDGKFYTVQCKATGSKDNTISLRSTGGTKGTVYARYNSCDCQWPSGSCHRDCQNVRGRQHFLCRPPFYTIFRRQHCYPA